MNKKFTVVLKRPLDIADLDHTVDCYVAHVTAGGHLEAIRTAQDEVWRADRAEIDNFADFEIEPRHYSTIVIFDGHAAPVFWGWME